MAVVTISSKLQLITQSGNISTEVAGESIEAGDLLYKIGDPNNGTVGYVKKIVNTSQDEATFHGIALTDSKFEGVVSVLRSGNLEFDAATLTAATAYVASGTAGKMMPVGDLTSGDHFSMIGSSSATDKLVIAPAYIGEVS